MNSKILLLKHLYLKKLIGRKYCKSVQLSQIQNITFAKKDMEYIINNCMLCELGKSSKTRISGLVKIPSSLVFINLKPVIESTNSFEMLGNIAKNVFCINDYSILSIIKCDVLGNIENSNVNACMPYLKDQLRKINPKIIILLGIEVAKYILNTNDSLSKLRGRVLNSPLLEGSKFIVTYSTSEIHRNSGLKKYVLEDCLNIKKLMNLGDV